MVEVVLEVSSIEPEKAPARKKSTRGEATRIKINRATLQIIKRDGMRGVRHRAVAKEAGVPLGATTYHYSNIENLIVSAFIQWRSDGARRGNPIVTHIQAYIKQNASRLLETEYGRETLSREIYNLMLEYEIDQIECHQDDRIIELAFYHESLLIDKLRSEVLQYWEDQLEGLIASFASLQSPDPIADARITQSIFHQLEREAVMKGKDYDRKLLTETLHRHVCHIIGVEFALL